MTRFYFFHRFILLPSFVGLVCCGCQPISTITKTVFSEESREADIEAAPGSTKSSAENPTDSATSPDNLEPSVSADAKAPEPVGAATSNANADSIELSLRAYQTALELASGAHTLSQSAISPDDWSLVASRWVRAADQLELVTAQSEHYQQAQRKITDYAQNAAQAQTKIQQMQSEVYVPLPPSPAVSTEKSAAENDPPTEKGRVRVPIVRRLHGTPVVQVTFNGTKQYEMILDTGASRTLITRQMANDLAVVVTEQMIAATASAAEVAFDIGRVQSMAIGPLTLSNAPVSIGDAVSIGLLGNDFFLGYDIIIRSREGVVELVKS